MTSVYQGGFSGDSVKYSAEGGKRRQEEGQMGPHSQNIHLTAISWSTMPGMGPLCRNHLVASTPETHLDQAPQAAELELESQERKQSTSVFCSQPDRSLRVASTWPTA